MPPDSPSPYLSNQDLLDIIKNAPLEYENKVMDTERDIQVLKDEMQKYLAAAPPPSSHQPYRTPNYTWDKQFQEQKAMKDMEERLRNDMRLEIKKVEEMQLLQMRDLERAVGTYQKNVEELITALVAQNRELSRRVTDLEWDGITP